MVTICILHFAINMAALVCVKTLVRRFVERRTASAMRCLNVHNLQNVQTIVVRQMSGGGHKRVMDIKPSNYEWKRYADHFNFYFLLGAIPAVTIISAVNLFIGAAELVDTPEDYEPKHWEYYKHPITRFHSRYIQEQEEKIYERHLHFLNLEQEKIMLRKLRKKVEYLAGSTTGRFDSSFWYYQPVEDRIPGHVASLVEEDKQVEGVGYSLKW